MNPATDIILWILALIAFAGWGGALSVALLNRKRLKRIEAHLLTKDEKVTDA